mgnify:CR=1 FL=1
MKTKIIEIKNDALFFDDSIEQKFEEYIQQLIELSENFAVLVNQDILKNSSPEQQKLLQLKCLTQLIHLRRGDLK